MTVVDAAEGNRLTAMAIVTTPAYPAATALSLAAELSLDAIRDKLWRMLYERLKDRYCDVMQVGADYALLYFPDNGTYQRAEFEVGSADIVLKDVYEVRFERVEKVNEMENVENTVVDIDVKLATAEVEIAETVEDKTEEVTENVTVAADEPHAVEVAEVQAEAVQDEEANEVERLKAELEEARKQILEANEAFENYKKAAVEAAEAAAKKEKMVAFAQKLRLNMEDEAVAQAIEANDYEALAAQVENVESASVQYTIAAEMDTRPYGSMFDRT